MIVEWRVEVRRKRTIFCISPALVIEKKKQHQDHQPLKVATVTKNCK